MEELPNYEKICKEIPSEKEKEDYTYNERRATILNRLKERVDPSKMPTYESMGEEFGVSKTTIKKDMDKVKCYIRDNLDSDVKVRMKLLLDKAIQQYEENGEYKKAFDCMKEYAEWLFDEGSLEKTPEKRQVQQEGPSTDEIISRVEKNLEKAEEVRNS